MSHYPPSILNVIRHLSRLPGVGEKTAERLTLHILRAPRREAEGLARSILNLKEKTRLCETCFSLSDTDICRICGNPSRDRSLLCVVENVAGMVAIERSGAFYGLYHVLHGVLSPMDGVGPDDIRIRELMSRIDAGEVREVVLATNTNLEGEATASYIADRLSESSVRVSRIASGVPMGGDLTYVDQVTLKRAMDTRHAL